MAAKKKASSGTNNSNNKQLKKVTSNIPSQGTGKSKVQSGFKGMTYPTRTTGSGVTQFVQSRTPKREARDVERTQSRTRKKK